MIHNGCHHSASTHCHTLPVFELATFCVQSGQDLCLRLFAVQISATASPVAMLPCAQSSAESSQPDDPDNQWEARISDLSTNCEQTHTVGFGHGWVYHQCPQQSIILCLGRNLLPPKLQRRGLVFKGKLVTMERV